MHEGVPHFKFPFKFHDHGGVRVQTTEQDSEEEVLTCVQVILNFPLGHRIEKPEFGSPDPTLKQSPPNLQEIEDAVRTWEPRAEVSLASEDKPGELTNIIATIYMGGVEVSRDEGKGLV